MRYWEWLTHALRGDFGISYIYRIPVTEMLADKLPITALLTLLSFLFTVALSIPLGILAGSVRNRVLDRIVTAVDQVVMSIPPFFIGGSESALKWCPCVAKKSCPSIFNKQ